MITQLNEMNQEVSHAKYQLIKDEQLTFVIIASQLLAGSRILKSTYRQVVFSDCTFYACDFNNICFIDCVFDNCKFEFSHFRECHFTNCNFSDCSWPSSSYLNSIFKNCDLEAQLKELLSSGKNVVKSRKEQDFTTDIYIALKVA